MDVSTYLLAFKWAKSRKNWVRKLLYVVVVIGSIGAAWLGISDGKVEVQDVLPSLLLLGSLGFYIRRSNDVTALSEQIRQLPEIDELSTWTITENGYEVKTGDVNHAISWANVLETVSTPDGVLVYVQKDLFEWLPKAAFASEADYDRFLTLLAAKTKHSVIN